MKRVIFILMLLLLITTACTGDDFTETSTESENKEEEVEVKPYAHSDEAYNESKNKVFNKDTTYEIKYLFNLGVYQKTTVTGTYNPDTDSFDLRQESEGKQTDANGETIEYSKTVSYTVDSNNNITNEDFEYELEDEWKITSPLNEDKSVYILVASYTMIMDDFELAFKYSNDEVTETNSMYDFKYAKPINMENEPSELEYVVESNILVSKNRKNVELSITTELGIKKAILVFK